MMKQINQALLSLALLCSATGAAADGFYLRWDLGAAWLEDQKLSSLIGPPVVNPPSAPEFSEANLDFDTAFVGQVGVGYQIAPYWRIDLTGIQTNNFDVVGTCIPSNVCLPNEKIYGSVITSQLYVNGYFEFAPLFFKHHQWFNPYVGAGIGFAHNAISEVYSKIGGIPASLNNAHSQNSFAWRVMGGIAFALTQHVFLDLAYTYTDAGELETGETVTVAGSYPLFQFDALEPGKIDMDLQQVMLGLRFQF